MMRNTVKGHQRARDHMDAPGLAPPLPPRILSSRAAQFPIQSSNPSRRDTPLAPLAVLADSPCFCITPRVLTTTLEEGRMSTWRFPRRSALTMLFWVRQREVPDIARVLRHQTPATCPTQRPVPPDLPPLLRYPSRHPFGPQTSFLKLATPYSSVPTPWLHHSLVPRLQRAPDPPHPLLLSRFQQLHRRKGSPLTRQSLSTETRTILNDFWDYAAKTKE